MKPRPNIERALARRFSPLARFRMSRGLRQSDVAVLAGIHETTVGKIETGVRFPTDTQVRRCAKALRTTINRMEELVGRSRYWARTGAEKRIVRP